MELTIRIVSTQHVTGRPKYVHFDVALWPLFVENVFELIDELSASFHALWSRYQSLVKLSDVVSEPPLLFSV